MRFTNKNLLYKHLDWHYQFNMDLKDKSKDTNLGRVQLITIEVDLFGYRKDEFILWIALDKR